MTRAAGAELRRAVCPRCGRCWEAVADGSREVDSSACAGCRERAICESRPTWLAAVATSLHELADGTRVLVRPLLYSDRHEIGASYRRLSDEARRLRFFAAPPDLSEGDLEYLANLDYRDHFAWAAFAVDDPGLPGIGVARYIRRPGDASRAEAAVTVLDGYGRQGLGTLLLVMLAERARQHGITTFVSYILWANTDVINALVAAGGRVEPDEPGVARVEIDLPGGGGVGVPAGIAVAVRTFARATLALVGLDRSTMRVTAG